MKKKIFIICLVSVPVIFLIYLAGDFYYKDQKNAGSISNKLRDAIPKDIKTFLKKTIFIVPTLKRENIMATKDRDFILYKSRSLEKKYYLTLNHEKNKKNIEPDTIKLKDFLNKQISINSKKLNLQYFQVSSLTNPKHANAISTAYLADYNDKIIFSSGDGDFYYFLKSDLSKKEFEAKKIKSNFNSIMQYPEFKQKGMYGIKDLFIKDNILFATSSSEQKKNCFNTAIYSSKIDFSNLDFKKFYEPTLCVKKELAGIDEFSPYHSGGRLFNFDKEHILFSVGEWRNRPAAQDQSNNLGKIIKLNIETKTTKIMSMGHRNAQGLYYDNDKNIIISTEHGPAEGDEININKTADKKVVNFGWPISSYGEHYAVARWRSKGVDQYAKAPLNKSHKKYGFQEPLKYYSPALGISQIIKISKEFKINDGNEYFLGTMGSTSGKGLGLRYLRFDKDYSSIVDEQHFYLKERIRDIEYVESLNAYLLFFEISGSIGVLKHEN